MTTNKKPIGVVGYSDFDEAGERLTWQGRAPTRSQVEAGKMMEYHPGTTKQLCGITGIGGGIEVYRCQVTGCDDGYGRGHLSQHIEPDGSFTCHQHHLLVTSKES